MHRRPTESVDFGAGCERSSGTVRADAEKDVVVRIEVLLKTENPAVGSVSLVFEIEIALASAPPPPPSYNETLGKEEKEDTEKLERDLGVAACLSYSSLVGHIPASVFRTVRYERLDRTSENVDTVRVKAVLHRCCLL